MERIIGKYKGEEDGPLVLCLGGMHGNEPAGIMALELIFKMLEVEPITNPEFNFRGTLLGVRGNLQALARNTRFIDRDLNRSLVREDIDRILNEDPGNLTAEDLEIHGLVSTVRKQIEMEDPNLVVVLDLHTTTAFGGIFVLASGDPRSIEIGIEMHAPVITGFGKQVRGTTMDFFLPENFDGRDIVSVVFESGQHTEHLSVNRAIAATINCLRTVGCVESEHVENRHDYLLREYSEGLPKVARLLYRYNVDDPSSFEMEPDFKNFQHIERGQLLAHHNGRPVYAKQEGLIIMPKYQVQGNDGFFLVQQLDY